MGASLSWRRTTLNDLPECLSLHPAKNGSELVGSSVAMEAWRQLLSLTHASRSVVIEMFSHGKREIVGFGFATFVKKSFADREVLQPTPGLNARIIESVVSKRSVAATYEEVRLWNTTGELEQVILDTSWKSGCLNAAQVDAVRILLGQAYLEMHAGYRFFRILSEMVDALDLWHLRGQQSVWILDRFESYRQANPDTSWNPDRALALVTAESMRADPHSIAAALFQHHNEPILHFTRAEQELLEVALDGLDDEAVSRSIFITPAAVKRRWSKIFDRVGAIRPDLCPSDADGVRGVQKRQRILTYARKHPEELRPFKPGSNLQGHRHLSA